MTIINGNGCYIVEAVVTSKTSPKNYLSTAWLETQKYVFYSRKEAVEKFKKHLKDNKLVEV